MFIINPFRYAATGYTIENAAVFDGSADYLSRTPAVAGNRKTWTWSGWVKRSGMPSDEQLFHAGSSNPYSYIKFADQKLGIFLRDDGGTSTSLVSTQLFRDPGAWGMLTVVCDTTEAVSADRLKAWWNGVEITSWGTETRSLTRNSEPAFNDSSLVHYLGQRNDGNNNFDGYLAEVHFVDGAALTADDFGEDDNGVWVPIEYDDTTAIVTQVPGSEGSV